MIFSPLAITISTIVLCTFFIQVLYYLCVFNRTKSSTLSKKKKEQPFISVIICARDEAENLEKNLPVVLEQDYPSYEVIVVNDASSDESEEVLKRFSFTYKHLHTTSIAKDDKFTHGKKLAVLVGIKAAKSDLLLFTDADCRPASDQWISKMSRHFSPDISFVLGYGGYEKKPGILNNFVRYDTFFIALQYLGFAQAGNPYMGVGRNLAYRKEIFYQNKGFGTHASLLSGDDDLIVNERATGKNTSVEVDAAAHTRSETPSRWSEWFIKKKRHLTTSKYYRFKSLFLLGGELFSRILFYAALAAWLLIRPMLNQEVWIFGGSVLLLRWIIMAIVFRTAAARLEEKHLLLSSFLYDILSPVFYLLVWISNLFSTKTEKWK